MKNHQKQGTFPFKTSFHLLRYHFRFPRYRRVKKRVIFDRLPSPSFSFYSKLSLAPSLTDLSQTADKRQTRFLEKRSTHFQEEIQVIHNRYENFELSYLDNRLRYRDKTKRDFNGTVSSIPRVDFNDISIFPHVFFPFSA